MIQEAYCSYEVAKLLKEKGFNEPIRCWYDNYQDFHEEGVRMRNTDCLPPTIMCPTHQMAMRWLREEKRIFIRIIEDGAGEVFRYEIYNHTPNNNGKYYINNTYADSYEEAVEEALKYYVENFI